MTAITAPARSRRRSARDRGSLPTDLTVRFAVLMLLLVASTGAIYGYLWAVSQPPLPDSVQRCLTSAPIQGPTGIDYETRHNSVVLTLACARPYVPGMLVAGVVAVVILAIATVLVYRLRPHLERRVPNRRGLLRPRKRRPLATLAQAGATDVQPELDRLARQLDLWPTPTVLVTLLRGGARVFGTGRHAYVRVPGHLITQRQRDPERFDAVVLHEFAHIKNRDVRQTFLAIAAYRVFLALAVAPYIAVLLVPHLFTDPLGWRPADLELSVASLHTTLAIVTLVILVILSQRAVLRTREVQADATAGRVDEAGLLRAVLVQGDRESHPDPGPIRRSVRWQAAIWSDHPTLARRLAALDGAPSRVSSDLLAMLGAGLALGVLTADLLNLVYKLSVVHGYQPESRTVFLSFTLAVLPSVGAIAWIAGIALWRRRSAGPGPPPVLAFSLALGAGYVLGQPLSIVYADANVWGPFDGVGVGGPFGAAVSAGFLIVCVAGLLTWSYENSVAWNQPPQRSFRWFFGWSAVVGVLGFVPLFTVWLMANDVAIIARLELFTPGLANAFSLPYWPGPGHEWLLAQYAPLFVLGAMPGGMAAPVIPLLVTAAGLARTAWLARRTPTATELLPHNGSPAGWGLTGALATGAAGAAVAIAAGVAVTSWISTTISRSDLAHPGYPDGIIYYVVTNLVSIASVVAAVVALTVWLRARIHGLTLGLVAALVTLLLVGVVSPVLTLTGYCGLSHALTCGRYQYVYLPLYSVTTVRFLNQGLILAWLVLMVAAGIRYAGRRVRRTTIAAAEHSDQPVIRSRLGVVVAVVVFVGLAGLSGLASYSDAVHYLRGG